MSEKEKFITPGSLYRLNPHVQWTFITEQEKPESKLLSSMEEVFLVEVDQDFTHHSKRVWMCFLFGDSRIWSITDELAFEQHFTKLT